MSVPAFRAQGNSQLMRFTGGARCICARAYLCARCLWVHARDELIGIDVSWCVCVCCVLIDDGFAKLVHMHVV